MTPNERLRKLRNELHLSQDGMGKEVRTCRVETVRKKGIR